MNISRAGWRRILLMTKVTDANRKKRKERRGGSGFDEQRSALFVAEGILLCRLSPETFITARRLLGIANVFDGDDVDPRRSNVFQGSAHFAESGIHMDKETIGELLS